MTPADDPHGTWDDDPEPLPLGWWARLALLALIVLAAASSWGAGWTIDDPTTPTTHEQDQP